MTLLLYDMQAGAVGSEMVPRGPDIAAIVRVRKYPTTECVPISKYLRTGIGRPRL